MKALDQFLSGRELLKEEIPTNLHGQLAELVAIGEVETYVGFSKVNGQLQCVRCGASGRKNRYPTPCQCRDNCFYCIACLQMGKIKACSPIYWLPEKEITFAKIGERRQERLLAWEGQLSDQQQVASRDIVEAIQTNRTHLVWAVAGAGKTEMLFEGMEAALLEGKRICVASPRIDVCLELAPRFQAAFPNVEVIVLYGEMDEPYKKTSIVVSTTHQLLRFRQAFDVLVIDEVDAFPFKGDETLMFGAQKSRKETSALIYLSATPDRKMQKEVKLKKLSASILPARYHQNTLPVPVNIWVGNWKKDTLKKPRQAKVIRIMKDWIQKGRRFLVFVPNIEWMEKFEQVCKKMFPEIPFAAVSSKDVNRKEKVMSMRREEYQFLLSTTILERGVTFPNVHVLVLGAENQTFTEAALVQISGRVGRSPLYPTGDVLFLHYGKTSAMKKAIKQIHQMNRLAKEKGYIKE